MYCLKYPERCKGLRFGYEEPLSSSSYPRYTQTKSRILKEDHLFNYNKQTATPDVPTTYLFNKAKDKLSEYANNIEVGSEVIEHTPEEVINSHLSQGAYETAYKGKEATKQLLKDGSKLVPELADFKVVEKGGFTNNNHTTYFNPKTNKVYIAFRGSDADFLDPKANLESVIRTGKNRVKNATDWGVNLHTLGGKEHTTDRYKKAVQLGKDVAKYFKIKESDINLTGHSLGGGQADHTAEVLGAKSVSFNPARNPLANRPVKEGTDITTHTTLFDPVSLPRNLYEKTKGTPKHIKKNIINSSLGLEGGWVNQHDLSKQYIEPLTLSEGKIKSVRTNTLRNTAGMLGSQGEAVGRQLVGGVGGLIMPYALTPEYKTKGETAYRTAENYAENLKINTALSPALYNINPMFALIDMPSLMTDVMSIDPMLPAGARDLIREKLGMPKKQQKLEYQPAPKAIQYLQKLTGRYKEEQVLKQDIEQANALGVDLNTYLNFTEREGDLFSEEGATSGKGVLRYSVDDAVKLAQKYHSS
jgi:hypothetical protein